MVVPLGLAGYFSERGYARVHELDWYGEQRLPGLAITALPAIHFSKRTPFDRNRTLWTGYAIQGRGKRVYFAGDTAYGPVFQEVGRRIAPFDLALLPIGAYEPRLLMQGSHATPEEALQIGRELGARRVVGDALGHDPADRRAAVRAAGALPRRGAGRGLRRGRRLGDADRRDASGLELEAVDDVAQ